jgi:hypothetical protein
VSFPELLITKTLTLPRGGGDITLTFDAHRYTGDLGEKMAQFCLDRAGEGQAPKDMRRAMYAWALATDGHGILKDWDVSDAPPTFAVLKSRPAKLLQTIFDFCRRALLPVWDEDRDEGQYNDLNAYVMSVANPNHPAAERPWYADSHTVARWLGWPVWDLKSLPEMYVEQASVMLAARRMIARRVLDKNRNAIVSVDPLLFM